MLGNPNFSLQEIQKAICFSPLIIQPETSVAKAVNLLIAETETEDHQNLLVVAENKLLGTISAKQIMALLAQGEVLENVAARTLMSAPAKTVYASELTNFGQIRQLFQNNNITEIPVLDDNSEELIGTLKRDRVWEQLSLSRPQLTANTSKQPQTLASEHHTKQLIQQLESEQFLNRLSEQIGSSLNLEFILDTVARQLSRFLNSDRALVYQTPSNNKGKVRSDTATDPERSLLKSRIPKFDPSPEWLDRYRHSQVQVVNDLDAELSPAERKQLVNCDIGSYMAAPIICQGKVRSLLIVGARDKVRCWRDDEIELVKRVANQCAIALERIVRDQSLRRTLRKHQQTQRKLENRQTQLSKIANSVPGGIYQFVATPEGEWSFPFANQGALALFGVPSDVDTSDSVRWFERIHPQDVEEVKRKTQNAIVQHSRWQCEFRVVGNQGIRWVHGIADTPYQQENGNLVFHGVVLDITERKNVELGWRTLIEAKKSLNNNNFFASVVEYIAQALQVNWVILYKKQANRLLSIAVWGNGQWQPNFTISEEEYTPCAVALRYRGLAYPEKVQEQFPNNPFLQAIGAESYISVPLLNSAGQVIGHLCILHDQPLTDINRLKSILDTLADRIAVEFERAEALANLKALNDDLENQVAMRTAELEKKNRELDNFFSASLDLLCIADTEGYFHRLNPQWETLLGYSIAELEGSYFLDSVHPDDRDETENAIAQLSRGEPLDYFVNRYRCADGSYRWLEWRAVASGNKIYAAAHDITQRKQTQEYLQQTNAELEQANRLKDTFLANMSHELRTPLNSILGITEGLQEQVYGSLNDKQLQSLNTIQRSGTHLLNLINDILDLSKIESGKLELDLGDISIQHLCRSTLAFVREMAHKKQISLNLELPQKLPAIQADEQRLRQALLNLLSNAIKFTPEQGTVTLSAEWIDRNSEIAFSVIDTGIGISEENLPNLFEPFVQVQTQLNRELKGTGLGLSLVKRLANLHGGDVSVSSTVGEGTRFQLTIPYRPSQGAENSVEISTDYHALNQEQTRGDTPLPKILIADDDEANLLTTCSYLEAKGYSLVVAKNGRDAIAQTLQEQPDIILMDIQMPELDGLEAIRELRAEPHSINTPIIALTAFAMSGDEEKCLDAGADQYYAKPIRLRELVNTINQTISL